MELCKIGVVGTGRGLIMMNFCKDTGKAKLVAVCDNQQTAIDHAKKTYGTEGVTFYSNFREFLKHDMDVVILANYATEHAPLAIAAMEAGKHVISEVLPVQTMSEAVALVECMERTGKIYCYAEEFCYMGAPYEMKQKYKAGLLGEFEYGEGEYLHNCEPIWSQITHGNPNHWRNNMSAFYYCTHSVGPLLHIAGMRPVRVNGFELPFNARMARMGAKAGFAAVEMITLENGALLKSLHGIGPSKDSIWYSVYGSKGRLESAREDAEVGNNNRIYVNLDAEEGVCDLDVQTYTVWEHPEACGHDGSDYVCLTNCVDYIMGDTSADVIDLYEALDMWMCGFFGYLSWLDGCVPKEIPDLRDPQVRELYRNDHRCTDPAVAGDQLMPSYSKGNPVVPEGVYKHYEQMWLESLKNE